MGALCLWDDNLTNFKSGSRYQENIKKYMANMKAFKFDPLLTQLRQALISCFLTLVCLSRAYADPPQQLFGQLQDRIYQIRLLEFNSANKSILGSGFQVDDNGLIATNYHVVAGLVQTPEKYRLEYIDDLGNKGNLALVDIDVIHDLALVRRTSAPAHHLVFSPVPLNKGEQIFSIGNPQDIGMTIINGNYGGWVNHTYYGRLLFSGSLNPGMSGGPAINGNGEVVGVNVSKNGEQLSYLVPAKYLIELMSKSHPTDSTWKSYIQQQLRASQQDLIDRLLEKNWQLHAMGPAQVPAEIADFISCWSDSNQDSKDKLYRSTSTNCAMKESLMIGEDFYTGYLQYKFKLLTVDDLNRFQLYSLVSKSYRTISNLPARNKDNADNFKCHTGFVVYAGVKFKNTLCARHYKDYPKLYDIAFTSSSVNSNNEALLSEFVMSGVEQETALTFSKRFMESISWISSSK
jgi:S1-C subfamily serine protease